MYPLTTPVAIATVQKLQNFALQPMEISKRYNSEINLIGHQMYMENGT